MTKFTNEDKTDMSVLRYMMNRQSYIHEYVKMNVSSNPIRPNMPTSIGRRVDEFNILLSNLKHC